MRKLGVIAAGLLLWVGSASAFTGTGSGSLWAMARAAFIASNFPGTDAGLASMDASFATTGLGQLGHGTEDLAMPAYRSGVCYLRARYDKWQVWGVPFESAHRGVTTFRSDSTGIAVTGKAVVSDSVRTPQIMATNGIISRLGPASSAGVGGAIRIVDGGMFTTIQAAINDMPSTGGLVIVHSKYTGPQPTSIPGGVSILTNEAPGKTILRGDIPTNSGKLILWNSQDVSLNPVQNALPYDSTIIQNQFAINLRGAGSTRIPVGIFSWVNVEGDMSVGQAAKYPNAVFGQIDVNGPSPLPASYGDVAGEFAVVLRGTSATALPDERGVFGRINGNANQPITRAVGVFGSVGTTASAIKSGYGFYATAPVASGTGTIDTCVTARFNIIANASAINRALHSEGETSIGGTIASPRILLDRNGGGQVQADSARFGKGLYLGGQFVNKIDGGSATLNFGVPAAVPGPVDLTITVAGAAFGDQPIPGAPVTVGVNYTLTAFVSAANVVTIRWYQHAGAAADPDGAGGTYTVRFLK